MTEIRRMQLSKQTIVRRAETIPAEIKRLTLKNWIILKPYQFAWMKVRTAMISIRWLYSRRWLNVMKK